MPPLSSFTAFTPIEERSDATPGLWNSRFQQTQDNILSLHSSVQSSLVSIGGLSSNTIQPESGNTVRLLNGKSMILSSYDSGGAYLNARAFGVMGDGATDDSVSLRSALSLSISQKRELYLPNGTYLFDWMEVGSQNTTVTSLPAVIVGESQVGVILQQNSIASCAIMVATRQPIESFEMRDLTLRGNAASIGGLSLGSSSNTYAAFTKLSNIRIDSFSKSGATGLTLVAVQELDAENCRIQDNTVNVWRPNTGFCTSAVFRGQKGFMGRATEKGVQLDGSCADITFSQQVHESNGQEAIYASGFASVIEIVDCYFEDNLSSGVSTQGTIHISGAAGAHNSAKFHVHRNHFHIVSSANSLAKQLKLDFVKDSTVAENSGLLSSSGITTTANAQCHFQDNADADSAADYLAAYRGLLGTITATETDADGKRVEFGNRRLDDVHFTSSQQTVPTLAVFTSAGTNATATLDATANDLSGQVTFTPGSGGWNTGSQWRLTFSRAFASAPRIYLTPTSHFASKAFGDLAARADGSSTTGFNFTHGIAASAANGQIWNYLVIE